jgi:hypothetical protein
MIGLGTFIMTTVYLRDVIHVPPTDTEDFQYALVLALSPANQLFLLWFPL